MYTLTRMHTSASALARTAQAHSTGSIEVPLAGHGGDDHAIDRLVYCTGSDGLVCKLLFGTYVEFSCYQTTSYVTPLCVIYGSSSS
jgi:hypothetical protein